MIEKEREIAVSTERERERERERKYVFEHSSCVKQSNEFRAREP